MMGGTDSRLLRDALRVRGSECETGAAGSSKLRVKSSSRSSVSASGVGGRMDGSVGAIGSGRVGVVASEAEVMRCLGGGGAQRWCLRELLAARAVPRSAGAVGAPHMQTRGSPPRQRQVPGRKARRAHYYWKVPARLVPPTSSSRYCEIRSRLDAMTLQHLQGVVIKSTTAVYAPQGAGTTIKLNY